jgi:hypothetical protein
MNCRKAFSIMGLVFAFAIMLPVVHADDWDQATRFTFSQPVQIPGRVLPAGTYFFKLADSNDRHIVQIFGEDRNLIATVFSIPCQRQGNGGDVAITLADRGATQPDAIVAWFYVGETVGHEFLYPKQAYKELAKDTAAGWHAADRLKDAFDYAKA